MLLRRRLILVLVVALVVSAGVTVWLATTRPTDGGDGASAVAATTTDTGYEVGSLPEAQTPAVQRAVDTVGAALSYDYRDLAAGLRSATGAMTADLSTAYRRVFARDTAGPARREQVVATVQVKAAGVVRAMPAEDPDQVLCLVFLDQRLTGGASDTGGGVDLVRQRVLVQVVRDPDASGDAGWLVDGIRPL